MQQKLKFQLEKNHTLLQPEFELSFLENDLRGDFSQAIAKASQHSMNTPQLDISCLFNEYVEQKKAGVLESNGSALRALLQVGPRVGRMVFYVSKGGVTEEVTVNTPVFMPVGTAGSVKALCAEDVHAIGYRLILGNTYHLALRPGLEVLDVFGGLHNFMNWPGAILTDSGGFQVMSLAKLRKLSEEGVSFANHINGSRVSLTPENVVDIQNRIGSDIQMVLDECTPYPATLEQARSSMERSMRWARRARESVNNFTKNQFGIVQGGMFGPLRAQSAQCIADLNFEGIAVGGLSVGESKNEMRRILCAVTPHLPANKPRYLMGVGAPDDLIDAVLLGIDMFDCVMVTRNARNGSVFVRTQEEVSGKLQIKNAKHKFSNKPLDSRCACFTCQNYSRSYLRHLFISEEIAVHRLLTIHSLTFLYDLMTQLRSVLLSADPWCGVLQLRREFVGTSPNKCVD